MKTVTFYHSMICPRCHVTGLLLGQIRDEFPDVAVEKLELLTSLGRARADGVWSIPTLVADGRKLSGVLLTKGAMRRFLESVSNNRHEQGLQGTR